MRKSVALVPALCVGLLSASMVAADSGVLLGEAAWPEEATLIEGDGCPISLRLIVEGGLLGVEYIPCPLGLTDPDLNVVAMDVGPEDVVRLRYPVPIINEAGVDVTVAQTFGGGDAANRESDVWISADGVNWQLLSHLDFEFTGLSGAYYTGSENEYFQIKETFVDLTDLGVGEGEEIDTLYVRGAELDSYSGEWTPRLVWVLGLHDAPRPQVVLLTANRGETISGTYTLRATPVGFDATKVIFWIKRKKDGVNDKLCVVEAPPYECEVDSTQYRNARYNVWVKAIGDGGTIKVTDRARMRINN